MAKKRRKFGDAPESHLVSARWTKEGAERALDRGEKALEKEDCESAFENIQTAERKYGSTETHEYSAGLATPPSLPLTRRLNRLAERFREACLRRR